jgi:hypothetical protein
MTLLDDRLQILSVNPSYSDPRDECRYSDEDPITMGSLNPLAELLVNATNGAGSISFLESAGEDNLAGKVLVDIANRSTSRRDAPVAVRLQYRLAQRADPAPRPAGTGGEDAPNDELRCDGRPDQRPAPERDDGR